MKVRPLILLRRLIVRTAARMVPWRLRALVINVLKQRVASLPPDEGLRLLFNVENDLYPEMGRTAVALGNGVHPKHRVTDYHDFFVQRIRPGECVLDVGCGNGALSADVAERTGATVVGIDLSAGNIAEARRRHAHPRVTYVVGDATQLGRTLDLRPQTADYGLRTTDYGLQTEDRRPETEGRRLRTGDCEAEATDDRPSVPASHPFGVVVLSNVLEHIRDRVGFLKWLQVTLSELNTEHRTLNTVTPPLRFLIRVPLFERDWWVPVKRELGVEWRLDPTHETEYTQEAFLEEVTQAGLMITHQEVRWGEIWAELVPIMFKAPKRTPLVSYLHPCFPGRLPAMTEKSSGGGVKYQWLARAMPDQGYAARILYAVSSAHRHDVNLVRRAKEDGVKFVWNQNGVYVPWTYPPDVMKAGNADFAAMLEQADYVLYQSDYCRRSAERFIGVCKAPFEVLPNAVDTKHFTPSCAECNGPLVLLTTGSHNNRYRLSVALRSLAAIRETRPDTRLIVAGRIRYEKDFLDEMRQLGVENSVSTAGHYDQLQAPEVFRSAHILLHTHYNDACPTVVLEAMACGLPVVHSASGGVPELVGADAGIGIPAPLDWQNAYPPDPMAMAEAVLKIADALPRYSAAARQRAVERFDINPWIHRHREIFEMLGEN